MMVLPQADSIGQLFSAEWHQTLCMRAEAAMAAVQARRGIIPAAAAAEIARTASIDFVPVARVAAERERLGHTFVAIIEPWSELLGDAAEWLHFGATSADVLDTVLVVQCGTQPRSSSRTCSRSRSACWSSPATIAQP